MSDTNSLNRRADIAGLRAVAVVAVLLFHLDVPGFKGGFIGVDIFFVISGYLMTKIVSAELRQERFRLAAFYKRRFLRIYPAMVATIGLSLAMGWYLLLPGDYYSMAVSAVASLVGFSNIFFLMNTGYFDASAKTMPLLHLWSLGVEMQFYAIWPLVVVLSMRWTKMRKWPFFLILFALMALSFWFYVYQSSVSPSSAFFLLPTRAWQLALGGCAAALPALREGPVASHLARVASVFALLVICASPIIFSDITPSLAALAFAPTLATAILLRCSGKKTEAAQAVLAAPPLAAVGTISYSLYLVHWPVIVFWYHYSGSAPSDWATRGALLGVCVALSIVLWRLVERPTIRIGNSGLRVWWAFPFSVFVTATGLVLLIVTKGAVGRIPPSPAVQSLQEMWEWPCPEIVNVQGVEYCRFGAPWNSSQHKVALWGDSHAENIMPMLHEAAMKLGVGVVRVGQCTPIVELGYVEFVLKDAPNFTARCTDNRSKTLKYLASLRDVKVLIVGSAWGSTAGYLMVPGISTTLGKRRVELTLLGLDRLVWELKQIDINLRIISQLPSWEASRLKAYVERSVPLPRKARADEYGDLRLSDYYDLYERDVSFAVEGYAANRGIFFVSPSEKLCQRDYCIKELNGELLYRDQGHLRRNLQPETNRELADMLNLRKLLE